jgi:hypothetical protein
MRDRGVNVRTVIAMFDHAIGERRGAGRHGENICKLW